MKIPNPYPPPSMDADADRAVLPPFDWERFLYAFVICTVGNALLAGTVLLMQATYALRAFSAEGRALGIVAVSAMRALCAPVVVTAAMLALVITIHRQALPSGTRVTMIQLWPLLLVLPIAAPIAACLIVGTALVVARYAHGAPFYMSWESIVGFALPSDMAFGLLFTLISAPLLVAVAPSAIRFTFAKPRRRRYKIAAAYLASVTVNILAGLTYQVLLEAFFLQHVP